MVRVKEVSGLGGVAPLQVASRAPAPVGEVDCGLAGRQTLQPVRMLGTEGVAMEDRVRGEPQPGYGTRGGDGGGERVPVAGEARVGSPVAGHDLEAVVDLYEATARGYGPRGKLPEGATDVLALDGRSKLVPRAVPHRRGRHASHAGSLGAAPGPRVQARLPVTGGERERVQRPALPWVQPNAIEHEPGKTGHRVATGANPDLAECGDGRGEPEAQPRSVPCRGEHVHGQGPIGRM